MAGHSHWAGIKHKKALIDAKRGKLWSRLAKAIIIAAKTGGGDMDLNIRLRAAVDAAKAVSMPKDNILRAIKKGTGELEGGNFDEIVYEGYGPNGVAVLCECLTDNLNRTAPEIRKAFEVAGGKLGKSGCVAWNFEKKGFFLVDAGKIDEDALMEIAIEAGADDVKAGAGKFEITCQVSQFVPVSEALAAAGVETEVGELSLVPKETVDLDADAARKVLKLMERLDDHDDVQSVSANFNISDEVMAELARDP